MHTIGNSDKDSTDEDDNNRMPGLQDCDQDDSSSDNDSEDNRGDDDSSINTSRKMKNTYSMKMMIEKNDTNATSPATTVS